MTDSKWAPEVGCKTFYHDATGVSAYFDGDVAMFVLRDAARRMFHQSYESSGVVGGDKFIQFSIPMAALREFLAASIPSSEEISK